MAALNKDLTRHELDLIIVEPSQMAPNNQGDTPLSIALERRNNGIVDKIIELTHPFYGRSLSTASKKWILAAAEGSAGA